MPGISMNSRALSAYFRELRKPQYAPIPSHTEILLAKQIHMGSKSALRRLVCANMRFVVEVAKIYNGRGVTAEDLIAAGNEGLLIAAQQFNGNKNFKFISYGVWWIRNRMLKLIAEQSHAMTIPEYVSCVMLPSINRRQGLQLQYYKREYSPEELAILYHTSSSRIIDITALTHPVFPLTFDVWNKDGDNLAIDNFTYSDVRDKDGSYPDFEAPDTQAGNASTTEFVRMLLHDCPRRDAHIIRKYFGIDGELQHTLFEIATQLGITRERVRQIVAKRLKRIRQNYEQTAPMNYRNTYSNPPSSKPAARAISGTATNANASSAAPISSA